MNKNTIREKTIESLKQNYITIIIVLFALQLGDFAAAYIFNKSSVYVALTIFLLTFVIFALFKDCVKDNHKKLSFNLLKISLIVFVMTAINCFMLSIASGFNTIEKQISFFRLSYMLNFTVCIAAVVFSRKDNFKTTMLNIYDSSLLEKLNIRINSNKEVITGDIQLCVNKETKKPVILPVKDRYLHMLILGPTGCGKTSQIILPMLDQDMRNKECGITVIEPKSDLAEKAYAMARYYGREAVYFNPMLPNCPYFNPLYGREEDVIENMATTFKMLNADSPQYFLDMNDNLIRNSLKVLKRLMGNKATLIELARLIQNSGGIGRKMVTQFSRLKSKTEEIAKENADITSWFMNDYFNEKSKTYENCSGLRAQVAKITANNHLRRVLNPPDGQNEIDFDKHLRDGGVITIATPQGELGDLARYLGYFIILQFQSAVFKRPGSEATRRAHFLYIDEFQVYSNPGFANMLTQGRSYRVASHLATQNRALMAMGGGRDGDNFVELVSTNARNVVIFPGGNAKDAKYYSEQFGEVLVKKLRRGLSKAKFNPLYGFQRISYPNESINESEEKEARFSINDIIYKEFGEITYCIIQNNTIQIPATGVVNWLPKELNSILDKMIEEYKESISLDNINEDEENEYEKAESEQEYSQSVTNSIVAGVKDPIAAMNKTNPTSNQTIKKAVIITNKPATLEDLPDEDTNELYDYTEKPKVLPKKEMHESKGMSGFMQDSNDDDLI